jgi:hypothetical protein
MGLRPIRFRQVAARYACPETDFHTFENPVTQTWAIICLPAKVPQRGGNGWVYPAGTGKKCLQAGKMDRISGIKKPGRAWQQGFGERFSDF